MVITVGQDIISAKRDLREIFPKEFANRLLINEFITYVLNSFFEKSKEKIVSAYAGEVVESIDGTECYIKEPTSERQINQLIPVVKAGDDKITYDNFLADIHNEGSKISDQNMLLASKQWSWCPPINVDMFLNYNNYYWIGYDKDEVNTLVLKNEMDVSSIIGLSEYTYKEYDEEGTLVLEHIFANGDRVVFLNDTSNTYNNVPYQVAGLTDDGKGYLVLKPVMMPLVVLDGETNLTLDAIGKANYTYTDLIHGITFDFINGMRLMFLNDSNEENNNTIFLVNGVGDSIELLNDEYDPYESLDNDTLVDGTTEYKKVTSTADYFVMERGCKDGNDWSDKNRWVHRRALEKFNINSLELDSTGASGVSHAAEPIICYNKDIELYNYGTFDRGHIIAISEYTTAELTGKTVSQFKELIGSTLTESELAGQNILIVGNTEVNAKQLYTITINKGRVILQVNTNGQQIEGKTSDGTTIKGDSVRYIGKTTNTAYYYNGVTWVEGQSKDETVVDGMSFTNGIDKPILFKLYDSDKVELDNSVTYPQSTFTGCKLFDYLENTDSSRVLDSLLKRYITLSNDTYVFNNHIKTDVYYYTPTNDYQREYVGYKFFKINGEDTYLNDWYLSNKKYNQYIKTRVEVNDSKLWVTNVVNTVEQSYYMVTLDYTPSTTSEKKSLIVYNNGNYVEAEDLFYGDSYCVLPGVYYSENLTILVNNEEVDESNIFYYNGDCLVKDVYSTDNIKVYYGTEIYDVENVTYISNRAMIRGVKEEDVMMFYILTDDLVTDLKDGYVYDTPISLTVNQLNEEIETIGYNNCFDQMIDIIENQRDIDGRANGSNNYSSLKADLSVGTKIVQNGSTIIRTMILNNNPNTTVRGSIEYVENAYVKFKKKFNNVLNQYYIDGTIVEDLKDTYETDPTTMDDIIKTIIDKINIGKEGLQPFYNNGILHLMDNAYVPSTPAYLGITNCYKPTITEFKDYTKDIKPEVIVGHDGSLTKTTGTVKDLFVKRLEDLIYDSINSKFKDTKCGINIYDVLPGYFRTNTYSREVVVDTYSTFVDLWANNLGLDYSENVNFEYDLEAYPYAWKTWNYTHTFTPNGEELFGSYRAIYNYYYDTYRPDTHPWEMLGFGEEPSWWSTLYGVAPYTSNNLVMWKDIENGYIAAGEFIGTYDCFKRPGLVASYLPVDESGNLKSPVQIGIAANVPNIQLARARWKIGDMGDTEFAYMQTSESKFNDQLFQYLLRPVEWVESNWDTLNCETLFRGSAYEQTINTLTNSREDLSKMVMHNEVVDGEYVKRIGIQQWIADYLTSNKLSISNFADSIRTAETCLGYRCAGYYQKGTITIGTDSYGDLPEENVHLSIFKTKTDNTLTYSGMKIIVTKKGYMIDGFDKSYPYFMVRKPEVNGRKAPYESNGVSVNYYLTWSDEVEKVPYKKEYYSIQDVYTVINGYGKYLEENENWYFNTRTPDGVISNYRTSSETFVTWAATQKGEETIGNVLLLNPGVVGLGNYNDGMVYDLNTKICGYYPVLDIYGNPIEAKDMNVFRQSYNTFFQPKSSNIGLVKVRTYLQEHLMTIDNKTVYGDTLYEPKFSTTLGRINIFGIKVKNWYGDMNAPGYLLTDDGAIPNYDKYANDLQYMFDVDDEHCQGKYAEYSRKIVGYKETKTFKELYKNNKSMFDFYKGVIQEKGTPVSINKMNRSTYISSTGNNISIYENWGFKAGEFGHTSDNSILEFKLEQDKIRQNPQVITFESVNNYYFDESETYNKGDLVIYNKYEYSCLYNDVTGKFDINNWKQTRFVGNYIVFWDDENWLKRQKNKLTNCFKYTDNVVTNPIGGFCKATDVGHIVADETELEETKDDILLGETVWIATTSDGDWDIRRKTGVDKFVSLRYDNLNAAYNQKETENIYHFSDNNTEYYTKLNSDDIEDKLQEPVYSDIDINTQTCRWCDIGSPIYTGEVGTYVTGKDYKVKLYNTVFTTMVDEDHVNNSTPLKELNSDSMVTYSNLLMNMAQFNHTSYKYRWKFSITLDTKSSDPWIIINNIKYDQSSISIIVCEGDEIEWSVGAWGCGERNGSLTVKTVDAAYDPTQTYTQAQLIAYNVIQPLSLVIPLSYRDGTVIHDSDVSEEMIDLPFAYAGSYELSMVGAGGGAGGGYTYRHRVSHGMHRRSVTRGYNGCAGASGAYVHGTLNITSSDVVSSTLKYCITTGAAGNGGAIKSNGITGVDTTLYKQTISGNVTTSTPYVVAQSGAGGAYAGNNGNVWVGGRRLGYGGVATTTLPNNFTDIDSRDGNNGGTGSYGGNAGASVYPGKTYGQGGSSNWGAAGNAGYTGYSKIVYRNANATTYDSSDIAKVNVTAFAKTIDKRDGYEYSAYQQPYILPDTNGTSTYFYSYDVIYKDDSRGSANTVTSSSKFYKNRSKTVTAYHNTDVNMNAWTGHTVYNLNDTVTSGGVYYICVYEHTSLQTFELTRVIGGETITLWQEYAPTYYYKITYNNGYGNTSPLSGYYLYYDSACTEPVLQSDLNSTHMTVANLNSSRGLTEGTKYTLVDEFATYNQLAPNYIDEPSWDGINQVGNYGITSGYMDYYEPADKETIEGDTSSLVYADDRCTTPVKYIVSTLSSTGVTYSEANLKYTDIINVVSDHTEPSYELRDNDIYMYSSKGINEITLDTPVYTEFALENELGLYGDYVPQWEKVTYTPNEYKNTLSLIDYTDFYVGKVKTYKTLLTSDSAGTTEIDLYYQDIDTLGKYDHFFAPSSYINTNELDFAKTDSEQTKIKLYKLNDYTVNTKADLPTAGTADKIYKVLADESRSNQITYYKYTNSSYTYLGNSNEVLLNSTLFTRYTDSAYVKVVDNASKLYPESTYTLDSVNQTTTQNVGNTLANVKMYYNPQQVGKYVESCNMVLLTDESEEISIMFSNHNNDYFYTCLTQVDSAIATGRYTNDPIKAVDSVYNAINFATTFVDKNELYDFCKNNSYTNLASRYIDNEGFFVTHLCKVCHTYRNINGSIKYSKLYLFGDKLYIGYNVIDTQTNVSALIGSEFGTIESSTTYTKTGLVGLITEDKIVNVIDYKVEGDYLYITDDSYLNREVSAMDVLSDTDNVSKIDGTVNNTTKNGVIQKGWMTIEYINRDYMFDLVALERKRVATSNIKSCYLVDNEDDSTIVKVQIFDPIQNVIPNNVLDEVNYISSLDPVNDYTDSSKWNDQKIGYLWWDTSKVKYVDYYQGDYEYRRTYWGKQLPGSEIVVNEWTRSVEAPIDGRSYITRNKYDYETSSIVTYYYYWEKNPVTVPDVSFRKNSALVISSIINNPSDEGITWMCPIDSNITDKQENSMIVANFNNVITGQEAVLQINLDSDKDVLDHSEWALVKEKTNNDIPEFLWQKLKDSLLGTKEINGELQPVPDTSLVGRQRLGISYRPRQTMFDKIYNARENFIDVVNDVFASRSFNELNREMKSDLPTIIDVTDDYDDIATTKLEMMSWRDEGLIGQRILVESDETLDNIWSVYVINSDWTYTLVNYQKYNITKYLSYKDWYLNSEIIYLTPTYTVTTTESEAVALCKTLEESKIVKYVDEDGNWELFQQINNDGVLETTMVGKSATLLQVSDYIYDYVNDDLDNTETFIKIGDLVLTKYQYIYNETQYLLEKLIEYFEV